MSGKTPEILFEDYYLAVVVKPAGISTDRMRTGDDSLESWFTRYLEQQHPDRKKYFCGLPNRLDKPVAGIVVLAKTPMALKFLSASFRSKTVTKEYHAWIEGIPEKSSGTLEHWISRDETGRKAVIRNSAGPGFKPCSLSYDILQTRGNQTFVHIVLHTGRFHQIRAQFAAIGHPVAGDNIYRENQPLARPEISLWSSGIRFQHPKTQEVMNFRLPADLLKPE